MPVILKFEPELNLLIGTMAGGLSLEMFTEAMQEIISSDEYPADVDTLWDLRKLDFSYIDAEFERRIIFVRKTMNKERGSAKPAFVVESDLSFGLMRMYQILFEGLSQDLHVFRTIEDAKAWLINSK